MLMISLVAFLFADVSVVPRVIMWTQRITNVWLAPKVIVMFLFYGIWSKFSDLQYITLGMLLYPNLQLAKHMKSLTRAGLFESRLTLTQD